MNLNLEEIKKEKKIEELIRFGILNIDKPSGPTSFTISDYVRRKLKINKTSHAGTLDPAVSGVLPIMLGRACRLSDYLMHKDKEYIGIMRVHKEVSRDELEKVITKFIGRIVQIPPLRSSVKRAERVREVKYFEILEIHNKDVLFKTLVEAGTYIRKICDDIGKEIGGAHMLELRRIRAGSFHEDSSVDLYKFDEAVDLYEKGEEQVLRNIIMPGEFVATTMRVAFIKENTLKKCLTGSPIFFYFLENREEVKKDEKIAVFLKKRFVGIYRVVLAGDVFAVPEFVFN